MQLKKGGAAPSLSAGTIKLPFGGLLEGTMKLFGASSARSRSGRGGRTRRDAKTVFVAGANGRLGSRIVRCLLADGFKVIGGVRDVDIAQTALGEAVEEGLLTAGQARSVTFVEFDVRNEASVRAAIGNAGKVVSALGAPETEIFNIDGPKQIDGLGSIRLVNVAAELGVDQFVMTTSLGTGKLGFPASALNLFWGILSWKKKAEEALEKSGMSYTIVRPGGMERPTDTYKDTHNVRLAGRDTTFSGQVSRLQIAELITECCSCPDLALNKCVEVVAETTAPLVDYDELLAEVPIEVTKEEQEEQKQAAAEKARMLAEATSNVEILEGSIVDIKERKSAVSERLKELKDLSKTVIKENAPAIKAASQTESKLERLEADAELKVREETAAKAILAAAQKAARAGEILSAEQQKEIAFPILQPEAYAEDVRRQEEAKAAAAAKAAKEAAKKAQASARKKAPASVTTEETEEEEDEEEVEEKPASVGFNPFAVFSAKPVEKEVTEAATTEAPKKPPAVVEKEAVKVAKKEAPKKPAAASKPPPVQKKKPIKATDRMAKPPPRAVDSIRGKGRAAAAPPPPVEAGDDVEARVLAGLQSAAKDAAKAKAEADEKAKKDAIAVEEKKRAAAVKAAEEQAKQAAEEKAAKAEAEKKAKEEAAAAAAAAEQAAKAKAEADAKAKAEEEAAKAKAEAEAKAKAEKEAAKAKAEAEAKAKAEKEAAEAEAEAKAKAEKEAAEKKVAEDAAQAKAPKATTSSPPAEPAGGLGGLGDFFSGFKAPWAQPSKADQEIEQRKEEARAWIDNWRSPDTSPKQGEARAWIDAWRSKDSTDEGEGEEDAQGTSEAGSGASEAREWIRKWRASNLEKQLPVDKKVK